MLLLLLSLLLLLLSSLLSSLLLLLLLLYRTHSLNGVKRRVEELACSCFLLLCPVKQRRERVRASDDPPVLPARARAGGHL
jgi:hypothetical protein